MSEKPKRMEFWKVVGTKHINGVDAKIQIPTFGKWRNYKAGELIKSAFLDELEKIGVDVAPPTKPPWWKPTRGAKIGLGVTGGAMLVGTKLSEGKKK